MNGRTGSFFGTVLGRVTMYRLVTLSLGTLAIYAFVLSLFGQVFYKPLELLATLATLLVVGYLTNRLFGALFQVQPHSESSVITSLLLFFILWPTSEPTALAWIALAATVASASKYLLAIRGRHVLNPAAIAALVMSVLASYVTLPGVSPSVWWVANPWLLPGVVILGGLVLVRTKRLTMALVFIVLSWALVTVRLVTGGQELGPALLAPLTSYPILFLAAFMLTEPLTLPPRRWQQLAEAAIVAALFSIPFTLGQVASTPELALIVGNVLAFIVARRRGMRLTLEGTRALTPTAVEYRFSSKRSIPFAAGQYLELSLPHRGADVRGSRRVFSISSPPDDDRTIRVAMRVPERASSFKRALNVLPVGASLSATGVWGDFVLPKDTSKPILLLAAGIGITPFVSQLSRLHLRADQRDLVLVYVVSDPQELAYAAELETWGTPVLVLGPTDDVRLPDGWRGLGPGRLDHERLAEAVPDLAEREVFISGPPAMIEALKPALRGIGVGHVRSDAFSGY
ncbi:FAD-dependent oxidoreductase [Plantibacter sp. MPB07]|uniref:FAD-dependent oxidoreductase n=1 Tax=Plantibacter sp. MPB07 TaxID=3388853 RepID=UPI00398783C8